MNTKLNNYQEIVTNNLTKEALIDGNTKTKNKNATINKKKEGGRLAKGGATGPKSQQGPMAMEFLDLFWKREKISIAEQYIILYIELKHHNNDEPGFMQIIFLKGGTIHTFLFTSYTPSFNFYHLIIFNQFDPKVKN